MGSFTIQSATYYSPFTIGGVPSGWNRQVESLNNPVYGPSTYAEQGGPIDDIASPNEIFNPDYSGSDATFLGVVSHGGRDFYFIQDQFGFLLGTMETNLPHADFPPGIAPSDVQNGPTDTLPACFLAGTCIATPTGWTAVEDLNVGDSVATASGATARVRWIGRQAVSTRFGPAERLMPVRVRAGALGPDLPRRDLLLTADHGLLIDGLLINAGALVNGGTVEWVPLAEFDGGYTVYHVETEAHEFILADGAPAETYIDYTARTSFDNYRDYVALYGSDRVIPEMPVPRVSAARLVPAAIRARLGIADAA